MPGEDLGFSEVVIEDGYGPIIDDGIIAPGREPEYKNRTKIINMKIAALAPITLDSIEVNPSLLPFIDHMEIETDVYDTNCPAIFRTGFRKSCNESAGITIEEMDTRSLLNDKRHALWNNCSVSQSTTKYWNYTSNPKAQFNYTPIDIDDLGKCNFLFTPIVKVSLIIYPKTPDFDGTPITLMRTYHYPQFVWDETLAKLYDPNQKATNVLN